MAPIPSFGRGRRALWRAAWPAARAATAVLPLTVERRGPPPRGAMVAVVNHFSFADPLMAGLVLRRPVRFLALDELWGQSRALDWTLAAFGAIPLPRERGVPLGALRSAVRHLRRGGAVGVFPEGRRVAEWGESPLRPGAAWLSLRTGAPVVPVALWGTGRVMPRESMRVRRSSVRAVVCAAISPAPYANLPCPASALTAAVRSVLDRELRRLAT